MKDGLSIAIIAMCATLLGAPSANAAAELIMVDQENCHWCRKWDAEVGATYDTTPVGRIAPLRKVDLHSPKPADLTHIDLGRATPVFILMEDGAEVGRVRGYPGKASFWMLLKEQLVKLSTLSPADDPPATPHKTSAQSSSNISRWVRPLYSVR